MATVDLASLSASDTSNELPACTMCGSPSSTACQNCAEGLDSSGNAILPVPYCSEDCQTAHASFHQKACKASNDRKQLYRAGAFVQAHWLEYRRHTCPVSSDWSTKRGEDGKLHVTRSDAAHENQLFDLHAEDFEWDDEKRSAVSWMGCDDLDVTIELARHGFRGIDEKVIFLCVAIKPDILRVLAPSTSSAVKEADNEITHWVFRIEVAGVWYAFDISGAQHGNFQPIMPWTMFEEKMVVRVIEGWRLGNWNMPNQPNWAEKLIYKWLYCMHIIEEGTDLQQLEYVGRICRLLQRRVRWPFAAQLYGICLEENFDKWLESQTRSLAELLHLSEVEYMGMLSTRTDETTTNLQQVHDAVEKRKGITGYLIVERPDWYMEYDDEARAWAQGDEGRAWIAGGLKLSPDSIEVS